MQQKDKDMALRRLKEILLSEDHKRLGELETELQALQEQIADKESLIDTLDPVIADVLDRKIVNSKDEFADILAPVIGSSIKKQVSEAKDDIVDALYPVIGKTIRKSVAEAMKNLVNSVNERIEKSLQSINIFQIIKSKITGVSQAELMLREHMPFTIVEMYIIRKEKGLLVAHAHSHGGESTINHELVGGMFEAISNFVTTAFAERPNENLNALQVGDRDIILDIQNTFYTAAVIEGVMPKDFPDKLNALGHRLHNRFYKTIREFDGDARPLAGCGAMLRSFMDPFLVAAEQATKKSKPVLLYFFIVLFLVALVFAGVKFIPPWLADRRLTESATALLAADSRVADNINITAKNGELDLSGTVPGIGERAYIDSLVRTLPDVVTVKNRLRILKSHAEVVERINLALTPFRADSENEIRFLLEEDRVTLEGVVPNPTTRHDIARLIGEIEGVNSVINNLSATRQSEREKLESFLEHNDIYFDVNQKELDVRHHRILDYLAAKILLVDSGHLTIAGYSDNLSSSHYNLRLSQERALTVASYLLSKNVNQDKITIAFYGQENPKATNLTETGRALNRRVEFSLSGS